MSEQESFPNPHVDPAVEDPYAAEPLPDSDNPIGASPLDDAFGGAGAPNRRRALILVAAAVVALLAVLLLSSGGNDEGGGATEPAATGQVDNVARAPRPTRPPAEVEVTPTQEQIGRASRGRQTFLDESDLQAPEPEVSPGFDEPAAEDEAPASDWEGYWPENPATGQESADAPDPYASYEADEDAFRQEMEAEAEARRQAAEQARLEQIRAEEERLRSAPTLIAGSNSLDVGPAGGDRFAVAGDGDRAGADNGSPTGAGEIVPGTKVRATLISEYISDVDGSGTVEARLSQPLRSNGRTILPAGTRAFGSATANSPSAGREARVSISFNTFVTPDGEVVRDVAGQAADPETLAMSIEADVDRRYAERLLRGVAATAVDLAISGMADDRRSTFEAPSPRDEAINDARRRAGAVIMGDIGDENSVDAAVRLEQGTPLTIIFGL